MRNLVGDVTGRAEGRAQPWLFQPTNQVFQSHHLQHPRVSLPHGSGSSRCHRMHRYGQDLPDSSLPMCVQASQTVVPLTQIA